MGFRATLLFILALFAYASHGQLRAIDSLYILLDQVAVDTTKINILISLTEQYNDTSVAGLNTSRQAFELARISGTDYQKAKTASVYGVFRSRQEPDSGIFLLQMASEEARRSSLSNLEADNYFNLGVIWERLVELDSSIKYFEKSVTLSQGNQYPKGVADASYALASIYNRKGESFIALNYARSALNGFQEIDSLERVSQTYNSIGIIYDYMGLYDKALESYFKARELAIEANDADGEILILNNLGVTFDNMKDHDESMRYYNEALEISGIYNYEEDKATLLNNISFVHLNRGDTAEALKALWESIRIGQQIDVPCFDIYPLEGVGAIYVEMYELDSAEIYLKETLEKAILCEDVGIQTAVHKNIGKLYAAQNKNYQAQTSFIKSLEMSQMAGLVYDRELVLYELYTFFRKMGNTQSAIRYLEDYQQLSDSLHEANTIENANQLAAEYEFKRQVDRLEREQEEAQSILEAELKSKRTENLIIISALAGTVLFAIILYQLYHRIRNQNKKLKWLNEEKNTLMGVVAHDLRNPLNMIKGLMQVIEDTKAISDDKGQYMHLIKISTSKMSHMIDNVLDISAVENMKVNLSLAKSDLADLVSRSAKNFDQIAAQKDISIQTEIAPNSKFYANIDSNYFDQILDNLISNAIKFSDKGKKIILGVSTKDEVNIVTVADEGPGLSKSDQEQLFRKFTTLGSKPTSDEQSTGLGLSIVKKFMDAMSGQIAIESEPGKGTKFFLSFKAV